MSLDLFFPPRSFVYFPRSDNALPKTTGYVTAEGSSQGTAGDIPWGDFWQASNYFLDGMGPLSPCHA